MIAIEGAIEAAGFKSFASMLRVSPFAALLESGEAYTIFAPTDAAFSKLPKASQKDLLGADADILRQVAGYHFAAGKVMTRQFAGKRIRAMTVGGEALVIDGKTGLRVNTANLVQPDIIAGACVIHGIDGVLWPHALMATAI
jgi:uncharacterized surface protein with fasciclin (FAS1) repeats